jgi:hypothetical protein
MKQTRQAVHAVKQSIFLDVYEHNSVAKIISQTFVKLVNESCSFHELVFDKPDVGLLNI